MKARGVVFTGPEQVEVRDVDLPKPGPKDVLIKVLYSGVSIGTEGWILKNGYKGVTYPLVTGYQHCGVAEQVGAEVADFREGDLVYCGSSRVEGIRPMWAGHVSYSVQDAAGLIKVPAKVLPEEAALGVMPAVPWHGIQMTGINPGDLVVVVGLGLVGQFAVQLARTKGATVIATEVLEKRRELARQCGAEFVLDPRTEDVDARVKAVKPAGADVIIDTSANASAVNASFEWIRRDGRYCLQGYYSGLTCLDLFLPHVKQMTFINPTGFEGIATMFDYIDRGLIQAKPLITHCFDGEDAAHAYDLMLRAPQETVGIVLRWN